MMMVMMLMMMMMMCCLWQRPGLIQGGNEGDSRQERGGTAAKYGHTGLFIFSLPHNQPADLTELTYFNLPLAHSTILLLFYADPAKRDLWPH